MSVSVSCLEFGLIPVGRTNTLSFRVISHTNCSLSYAVRQLVEGDRDGYIVSAESDSSCDDLYPFFLIGWAMVFRRTIFTKYLSCKIGSIECYSYVALYFGH